MCRLLADKTHSKGQANLLCGCNETGYHCLNVNLGRDTRPPEYRDLRLATAGEQCPACDQELKEARGIEVGHIFKLGTKYSAAMEATFMSKDGKPAPFVMGCYGIGVSRIAAAAVEQSHDDKGIVWQAPLAPFQVVVAIVDGKRDPQRELAESLYAELLEAGFDACLDDRPMRPGVKFKDLDLLGFPVQVIVGRGAEEGRVELNLRKSGEKSDLEVSAVLSTVRAALEA